METTSAQRPYHPDLLSLPDTLPFEQRYQDTLAIGAELVRQANQDPDGDYTVLMDAMHARQGLLVESLQDEHLAEQTLQLWDAMLATPGPANLPSHLARTPARHAYQVVVGGSAAAALTQLVAQHGARSQLGRQAIDTVFGAVRYIGHAPVHLNAFITAYWPKAYERAWQRIDQTAGPTEASFQKRILARIMHHVLRNIIAGNDPAIDGQAVGAQALERSRLFGKKYGDDQLATLLSEDTRLTGYLYPLAGLSGWELEAAWEMGYGRDRLPDGTVDPHTITWQAYRQRNLGMISRLNTTSSGRAKRLRDLFLIRNFRHSAELYNLLDETAGETYDSDVIAIVGGDCPNGALSSDATIRALTTLQRELLAQDIGFRLFEGHNLDELQAITDVAEAKGWAPSPVLAAIIHGNRWSLQLGRDGAQRGVIKSYDISTQLTPLVRRLIRPDGKGIFASCELGQPFGFAETLHLHTGRDLDAATEEIALRGLRLTSQKGERPQVEPTFMGRKAQGNTWVTIPAAVRQLRTATSRS